MILETFGENIWNRHSHFSLETNFFVYKLNFDFLLEQLVKKDQIFFFRISTPNFERLLSLAKWVIGASFIWIGRSVLELFDLKVSILTWGFDFNPFRQKSGKIDFNFKSPYLQDLLRLAIGVNWRKQIWNRLIQIKVIGLQSWGWKIAKGVHHQHFRQKNIFPNGAYNMFLH